MKKKGMDLTEGPIFKKLVIFVLPIIASSLLQQFYNTADQMVVGKVAGVDAHAAVGATTYMTNLLLNLFVGMSIGATVTCAKYFGAKDREGIHRTVHTSIALALFGGVIIGIVGLFVSKPLLSLLDTPKGILDRASNYMSLILAGSPFSLVYNYGAGLLRASGDTKRPLYILSISGLINVILNLVFVICFNMEEVGVGLATVISQMVSSVSVVLILIKRDDEMHFEPRRMRFHKAEFLNILRVGVPSGLNAILFNFANLSLQSTVNSFGKEYISANTAAASITNYISLTQNAVGTGIVSFVGQNYGAKRYDRIKKVVNIGLLTLFAVSSVMALVLALMPETLLGLFTKEAVVAKYGVGKALMVGVGYIIFIPSVVYAAALRGMERSKTPMNVNIISICVSRLAWLHLVYPLFEGSTLMRFNLIFVCLPMSWLFSSIAMSIAFYMLKKKFPKTPEKESPTE
ncbi:MAG: MATE family efflux transporter [Ruminococcaceae bacterium]|nr:MATE family efflux transporter [Oscillospiraceae bacterium]